MKKVILFLLCLVVPFLGFASFVSESRNSRLGKYCDGLDGYGSENYVKILILSDMLKKAKNNTERQAIRTCIKLEFLFLLDVIDFWIENRIGSDEENLIKIKTNRTELKYMMDSVLGQ